ncbi:MAG TPA: PEGA domain-containing protein [Pseudomonadota bacterium]|nr:PEGA domain-containing protein [Pseudomonadota bacterium]
MKARITHLFPLLLGLLWPSLCQADVATKNLPPAVYAAPLGEPLPPSLAESLGPTVRFIEPGPVRQAAAQVVEARAAIASLRCSEVVPRLRTAGDALLGEVPIQNGMAVARDLFGLLLLCADRIGDVPSAERAARFLATQKDPLPADLALILPRYQQSGIFGPPRAPVKVESDPPGATVMRNDQVMGTTPLTIDGGRPDVDFLTLELPGMRKLRRPLGSGENLFLSLRPEDRLPLLFDQVAGLPIGSEQQTAVLKELAGSPTVATQVGTRLLVFGPKLRDGKPVVGESLVARVFDFARKDWLANQTEIPSGNAVSQAAALAAVLSTNGPAPSAQTVTAAATPAGVQPVTATNAKGTAPAPAEKSSGSKLPFAKTKWYTWVVAGGVAALIGGLLIAERFSKDKLTVTATH